MRGAEEMAPYSQFYQRVPQNNLRCASLYCAGLSLLEQLPVPPLPPLPRFRCSLIPVPRCGSDLATFSAIWPTLASLKACWWMTSGPMTSGLWFQDGRCFDTPCSVSSGGEGQSFLLHALADGDARLCPLAPELSNELSIVRCRIADGAFISVLALFHGRHFGIERSEGHFAIFV